MVKILVAQMTSDHGTSPSRRVKEEYAKGITSLFPNLADPRSKFGFEHYYNAEDGSGYLAWRLKFVQKGASEGQKKTLRQSLTGGPKADRGPFTEANCLTTESLCCEAIALMKHSADEAIIEQDCNLLFGDVTSAKFLEKWPTVYKKKVLDQSRGLTQTGDLQDLTGTSIQGHLDGIMESRQPYLLAVGTQRSVIHKYFIVIDKHAIPLVISSEKASSVTQISERLLQPEDKLQRTVTLLREEQQLQPEDKLKGTVTLLREAQELQPEDKLKGTVTLLREAQELQPEDNLKGTVTLLRESLSLQEVEIVEMREKLSHSPSSESFQQIKDELCQLKKELKTSIQQLSSRASQPQHCSDSNLPQ
ncbi:hypothetical protein JOQ06_022556, partial [Pogonophryne albipinna]